ncbi:LPD29 domain-containing protein [Sulfurospirillum sp. MES]|uniref:LPD29 domain-containing protein n=1 Tax=Sulfurospirillum sp. MES TaxID=1565314 RepID=UPI000542D599|nr:LPD29 domain-containing protein [Sulfurospirillum sp. MES]KHG32986.1 MAG: hypothetical protein OA34_12365 [Sulfurospirillum sp. MES]
MSVNKETMKSIRAELKALFPTLKFSVRMRDYSCVCVDLLEGDIDVTKHLTDRGLNVYGESRSDYISINEFYIDEHFKGQAKKLFNGILNTIYKHVGRHYDRNAGDMGADYAGWNYHIYLHVGQWNKPYILKEAA